MGSTRKLCFRLLMRTSLPMLLLSNIAPAQAIRNASPIDDRQALIDRLKNNTFTNEEFSEAVGAGMAEEIKPILRNTYAQRQDGFERTKAAAALARLKDTQSTYGAYLRGRAAYIVAESDTAPDLYAMPRTTATRAKVSVWASKQHLTESEAEQRLTSEWPAELLLIAATHDQASLPAFRHSLKSNNSILQMAAVIALAEMTDYESVPDLIQVCNNAPPDIAKQVAENLIYFTDSRIAQATAEQYLDGASITRLRMMRDAGIKPLDR